MKVLVLKGIYWIKEHFLVICTTFLVLYGGIYIMSQPITLNKVVWIIVGLCAIIVFTWFYMHLSTLYKHMIHALTVDCDLTEARQRKAQLQHWDILHGYRQSLIIFDALCLLDEGQWSQLAKHLNTYTRFFHGSYDYLAIYDYLNIKIAFFTQDWDTFDHYAPLIKELLHQPYIKHPLFSEQEIDALIYYRQQRYTKSMQCLSQLHLETMNQREQAYVALEAVYIALANNDIHTAHLSLQQAQDLASTFFFSSAHIVKGELYYETFNPTH